MEELLSKYLENGSTEKEFEVRFGTKQGKITKIDYDNVIKKLKSLGFKLESNVPTDNLRIMFEGNKVRCNISGLENITNYCKNNSLNKINVGSFEFISKEYPVINSQELKPFDNTDFNFRVSYQHEKKISDVTLTESILTPWKDLKKTFRYINRISYVNSKFPNIRVDLSVVKSSIKTNYGYKSEYTIKSSNIFNNSETYEIEIEVLPNQSLSNSETLADLKKVIKFVICGLQETNYPISKKEQLLVLYNYAKIIKQDKQNKLEKIVKMDQFDDKKQGEAERYKSTNNFIGPNQITLQFNNIIEDPTKQQSDNINNNYTVTEKADGLRKLLYVDYQGKIYLITTNMKVQFTGMITSDKTLFNSILDGEHILFNKKKEFLNSFAIFDIYFINNNDVRTLPLYVKDEKNCRYNIFKQYATAINKSSSNIAKNNVNVMRIHSKKFYISTTSSIFSHCNTILNNIKNGEYEYETDGLIFTPALLGVGQENNGDLIENKKKTWTHCFKWKPAEFNTVDFLVTTKKNKTLGKDEISEYFQKGQSLSNENQILQYKTLTLRCGFSPRNLNPLQQLIDDQINIKINNNTYTPKAFYPTDPVDTEAHICNIKLTKDLKGTLQMTTEEGDVFTDNTIVEFKYDLTKPPHWRWIPIKVRYDKTAKYLSGEKEYGNSYDVANSNWKTIHQPITHEMISTGKGIPNSVDNDVYYNRDNKISKTVAMRNFHNKYIKHILINNVSKPDDTLIDFAVGKAGDLNKWKTSRLSFVFGIDVSKDNIENKVDGACVRYIKQSNKQKNFPNIMFAVGNSQYNFKEGNGFTTDKSKVIYNAVIGRGSNDPSMIGKGVHKNYGKGKDGFNIASCQFALHYFFEDVNSLKGFIRNVSENTKVGGYFIGTCYDGSLIFNKLRNLQKGDIYNVSKDKTTILEITKQYDDTEFNNDSSCLGYAIEVLQETINVKWKEYLVNFNYLVRVMENYGFSLLSTQELKDINMPNSLGNFGELFNKMKLDTKNHHHYGEAINMTPEEKEISFLNKYFIFKKNKNVDTTNVTLDVTEKIKLDIANEEEDDPEDYDKGYEKGYNNNPDDLYAKGYRDAENGEDPQIPGLIEDFKTKFEVGYNEGLREKYIEGYNDAKIDMGEEGGGKIKLKIKK